MNDFQCELKLRIDWSELDLFGHVNNVMYFKYFQAARVNYWMELGMNASKDSYSPGWMLASTNCQFRQELLFPGEVTVRTKYEEIKNTSTILLHNIYDHSGNLAAEGKDVIVYYDFEKKEKLLIPEVLRKKIQSLKT